ncbi:hypothetical protein, conserved [Trypanosoma brucei brucei TREU927]|uniref:PQ loop repeat protein n=1 Tax=Trypanosoma brucei brucei (strain 927/4 GUTat10.1) TaxID=185431 RepID=Q38FT6_TRYB2|nr:hypothetical protein, conserved [Trypanosoma brucei brucei TREU927]EAN76334.1 hypothetical protein, conserved [Trypanosoma brucei brucei TREU927]
METTPTFSERFRSFLRLASALILLLALHAYASLDGGPSPTSTSTPKADENTTNTVSSKELVSLLFSIGMIFGPHIGYLVQLYEMNKTGIIDGYSPLVSVILLVSNDIRILYFMGNPYALPLLFQSAVAVAVHMVLLVRLLCIRQCSVIGIDAPVGSVENGSHVGKTVDETICIDQSELQPPQISPDDSSSYATVADRVPFLQGPLHWLDHHIVRLEESVLSHTPSAFTRRCVMMGLGMFMTTLLYYLIMIPAWKDAPQVVGYTALIFEAMLLVPQILRNHRRKCTEGLSLILLVTWVVGDIIKLVYFIVYEQPVPFLVCSGIQLTTDLIVIAQVVVYKCRGRRPSVSAGAADTHGGVPPSPASGEAAVAPVGALETAGWNDAAHVGKDVEERRSPVRRE